MSLPKFSLVKTATTQKAGRKVFASILCLSIILWSIGPFLLSQIALAAAPNVMHMSLWSIAGESGNATDLEFFTSVNDDDTAPTSTVPLVVKVHYKVNDGDAWNSTTTCDSLDDRPLHQCLLKGAVTASSTTPRNFYYYIEAGDGTATSCMSYATSSACSGDTGQDAQSHPFEPIVTNAPPWDNAFSGKFATGTAEWPGVKDGRDFWMEVDAPAGTSTVYVDNTSENYVALANVPDTWILLGQSEKFRITSTSTGMFYGTDYLQINLSGATTYAHNAGDGINKFIGGATLWIPGLSGHVDHTATSSEENATSTYGTFWLGRIPDGSWDILAFKDGYSMNNSYGMSVYGQSTSTVDVYLPFGSTYSGEEGNVFVMWSAPMEGSGSAPADINLSAAGFPMILAFPNDLNWTTVSTTTVEFKSVSSDGTMTTVADYSVGYQPMYSTVVAEGGGATAYTFGPDALIIIYSSTLLASSSDYVINITDSVKDINGNSVSGNNPNGGHSLFFSTGGSFIDFSNDYMVDNFGGGGSFMPPFVMNVIPTWGKQNVARNSKVAIEFDQTMLASTISATYVKVMRLNSSYNEISAVAMSAYALDRATNKIAILTPPSAGFAANTTYRVKVLGGVTSASGMKLAPPGEETNVMFTAEFTTGPTMDTVRPTTQGTSLDRYLSSGLYTAVPTAGVFKVGFSEMLDPNTVNSNNAYIRLKGSSTNLTASAEFDVMEGKLKLIPASALNATSTYILTLTGYLKDFTTTSNAVATTTYEFTTGSMDIVAPSLDYFNADDYNMSITFGESMNAVAMTNTTQWSSGATKWETSVLNPRNYVLYVDNGPPPSGLTAPYFGCVNLAGTTTAAGSVSCITEGTGDLNFNYDAAYKTVEISGLKLNHSSVGLSGAGGVRVFVNNVTDLSGNAIDTSGSSPPDTLGGNARGGPFFNSMDTFGMMGPGGGGMFGPPQEAGEFYVTDFGGKDPGMMGMMPVGVWPMNMVAGATSMYMIDVPITTAKAIEAGGKIVLGPFPDESDVSGAKNADPNATFVHYDINGPGADKVVLSTAVESTGGLANDGVTVSGQTVTITLGAVPTQAPDFLHFELDGIVNPTSPSVGGYKIAMQSQDSTGRLLESFTSMPFFLMPKGKYYIVGHATSTSIGLNNIEIFGGSPMTGPLYTTTANNAYGGGTDGEFQMDGLNAGDVMLMTQAFIEVGGSEYVAPMPEPIFLDDYTTADSIANAIAGTTGCTSATACYYYKKFTLTEISDTDTPGLLVYIYGDFRSAGVGTSDIDIFAGGPSGFRVKTLNNVNKNYSVTPTTTMFNLPTTGDYHVGIGPAMPQGPMGMGKPPMPTTWMPPRDEFVTVSGSAGTWVWQEGSATSTSDGLVTFTIQTTGETIDGHVYDLSGAAVPNAEVFAFSPGGSFGTNTHVDQDGAFTLNVTTGFYKVGAFLPGAPPTGEVGVDVQSGAFYVGGALTTDLILTIGKNIQSGYTISGTVYSDTSSLYPATDASVYAYRTDGPGHSETMTDSKGNYTLYVGPGVWTVGAYSSTYGDLTERTITITIASQSGITFSPSAAINYVTIRERVWQDENDNGIYNPGEGIARASVSVVSTSSDYVNSAMTDADGLYEVKVPGDTHYDVEVWSPDQGNLPPVKNVQTTTTDILYNEFAGWADVPTEHATTVTFGFYDSNGVATSVSSVLVQFDELGVEGVSNDIYKEGIATTSIIVATSSNPYLMDIEVKGIPKEDLTIAAFDSLTSFGSTTVSGKRFATTTVYGNEKIKITLPPLCYISGQVLDDSNTAVSNATIHIEKPGTDIEFDVESDSNGYYEFAVASSADPYLIQADKGGYIDSAVSVYASTTSKILNPSVEAAAYMVSGQVTVNSGAPGDTKIWAEKLGGGYVSAATSVDSSTGDYTLHVTDGDWEVWAIADGYDSKQQVDIIHMGAGHQGNVNLDLTSTKTLQSGDNLGMTGNAGGTLQNKDAGFVMNIPRSTISASDSSSYNVKEQEVSDAPTFTPTGNLIGDKAEEISAYTLAGSSGNVSTVSDLSGVAFIDKSFTVVELALEGISTVAEVEETKMAHYNDTAQNWMNVPTTISYLDSNKYPVVPAADLSNVISIIFNGVTKHFSTIGVVNTSYDGLPPAAPSGVAVTNQVGNVKITWTAVTANIDGTTASDVAGYKIYRSISPGDTATWTNVGSVGVSATTYYDTSASAGTTYYYKVTTDTGLQSDFSTVTSGGTVLASSSGGDISGPSGGGAPDPEPEPEPEPEEEEESPTIIAQAEETIIPTVTEEEIIPTTEPEVTIPTITFEKAISEMTVAEIQVKITEIMAVIAQLQVLLTQIEPSPATYAGVPSDFSFERTLKLKMTGNDVKYFQIVLNADPITRLADAGVGSPGNETEYFGSLTKAAAIKFQEKYASDVLAPWNLTSGTGLIGSTSRAKLNELLGH